MQLAQFIEEFKDTITQKTMQLYKPLYTFDINPYKQRMQGLLRKPFVSQAHCIAGIVKSYEEGSNSAFMIGEMGTGKTLIGSSIPYVKGFKKSLILCPPHLVKKWEREIKVTIPQAKTFILKTTQDIEKAVKFTPKDSISYFIISRERAKLSYYWKPAYILRQQGSEQLPACPDCGAFIVNNEGIPLSPELIRKKRLRCNNKISPEKLCNASLWQADRKGPRRYALSEYIKKHHKNYFDLLILDEVHEYKAQGSAQGYAVAALAEASKNVLAMTGTLLGGQATSLFYLLYRLTNDFRKSYGHNDSLRFAEQYGILERVFKEKNGWDEDGASSKRRKFYSRIVEKPGVSPEIITHLIDKTAFLRLTDVAEVLPPYHDLVEVIPMNTAQAHAYHSFASELRNALLQELQHGSKKLLGAYLQSLLAYPDAPYREEIVIKRTGEHEEIVASAPALDESVTYPKEKRLLDLCLTEKRHRRKIIIFCTHTGTRDITPRLARLLKERGVNTAVLKSHTTPSEKREDWVKQKVKEGIDVLICHPKLVQTGLDLIDFPTLIFYQIEYSVYTLRQASRRSWRIGQKQEVKVYYLIYAETIQNKGLQLIAKKVKASLMVEGELLSSGLSSRVDDDDMMTQLAKSLVDSTTTKESAEELFSMCRQTFTENQAFIGHEMEDLQEEEESTEEILEEIEPDENSEASTVLLWDDLKAQMTQTARRKRQRMENPNQLTLF